MSSLKCAYMVDLSTLLPLASMVPVVSPWACRQVYHACLHSIMTLLPWQGREATLDLMLCTIACNTIHVHHCMTRLQGLGEQRGGLVARGIYACKHSFATAMLADGKARRSFPGAETMLSVLGEIACKNSPETR